MTIDGAPPTSCIVAPSGTLDGKTYESRRCRSPRACTASAATSRSAMVAYGYGTAGSYAFVGGADVKKIYKPPASSSGSGGAAAGVAAERRSLTIVSSCVN